MTKTEAHELLNAAQAGADISEHEITAALVATGDADRDDYPHVAHVPVGAWEGRRTGLAPAQWHEVIA